MPATLQSELIRARTVLPITREPIADGAVLILDGVICEVGRFRDVRRGNENIPVSDLGETILMPGLINAHCHLDYTLMAGQIARPKSFPDWIKAILALKAHWSYSEYAESWIAGARQLVASGTTTVADIEAVPELLPEAWSATPVRVVSLIEMTGVRAGNQPARILDDALAHIDRLQANDVGLSPHALYSTPPELLRLTAETLRQRPLPAAIHVAESEEEWEMYQSASGPLYDWLKTQRPMKDCGGRSPIQQVHSLGLLSPRLLIIHANYLAPEDPALIAASGASVVHCPRSHAYFKHAPFQFAKLSAAGINICLGTDSLASIAKKRGRQRAELSLWDELRQFANSNPSLGILDLLPLVTSNAARALDLPAGALETGRCADLIAVSASSPDDLLSTSDRDITARIIGGRYL